MATAVPQYAWETQPAGKQRSALTKQRRSSCSCTHRQLTRLYDSYGQQRCMYCNRTPDFGYLYRCTQDTNGNLPISEFIIDDMAMDLADITVKESLAQTQQTMSIPTSAIFTQPSTSCSAKTTVHTDNDVDVDMATDEVLAQAYDGKRKFEAAFPPESMTVPPACNLKVCQACRPLYRDRAWQSLNAAVDGTVPFPSEFELENRRISNRATVLKTNHTSDGARTTFDTASFPNQSQIDPVFPNDRAHESGSDADDEKGFAKDEDSDTSNAESGDLSASNSEMEDLSQHTGPYHPMSRPASCRAMPNVSDLDENQTVHETKQDVGTSIGTADAKCDFGKADEANMMATRSLERRFEIE